MELGYRRYAFQFPAKSNTNMATIWTSRWDDSGLSNAEHWNFVC